MAETRNVDPSLLVIACFSRHEDALDWARGRIEDRYGPIALTSPDFSFHHTKYYEATMGADLRKRFYALRQLVPSDCLADVKAFTNILEKKLADDKVYAEVRPLNLDPGLLQLGKFLLASTKDQGHRIYLRDGIYAEVTLRYQDGAFDVWPWTYRDYREADVRAFLNEARTFFRAELAKHKGQEP